MQYALLIALLTVSLSAFSAPKPRIAICHFQGLNEETGEPQFKFKNLPERAANAHLTRHQDVAVVPGDTVTIEVVVNDEVVFTVTLDEDCDVVPGEV